MQGLWQLTRLESPAEICVNGYPVVQTYLHPQDQISIGKTMFTIEYDGPPNSDRADAAVAVPGSAPSRSASAHQSRSGVAVSSPPKTVSRTPEKPASFSPPPARANDDGALLGVLVPCGGGPTTPLRKKKNTVGRSSKSDVVVRERSVSSLHCGLEYAEGHWRIVDLGSTNGVKVNGVRYKRRWLRPSDTFSIGGFRFQIDYEPVGPFPEEQDNRVDTSRSLMKSAGIDGATAEELERRYKDEDTTPESHRVDLEADFD